jgi:hypothetical protein
MGGLRVALRDERCGLKVQGSGLRVQGCKG